MGDKNFESNNAPKRSSVPNPEFPVPVPEPKDLFGALMGIRVPFKPSIDENVYRNLPLDMQFQLQDYPDEANLVALSISRWDVRNNDLHRVGLHVPGSEERSVQYLRKELVDWQLRSEAIRNQARSEFPQISSLIGAIKRLERVGGYDEIFDRIYGNNGLYWRVQDYIERYQLKQANDEEILQIAAAEIAIQEAEQVVETQEEEEPAEQSEVQRTELESLSRKERIEMLIGFAKNKVSVKWADSYGIIHNFINPEVLLSEVEYYRKRFEIANQLKGDDRTNALKVVDNLIRNDFAELLEQIKEKNLFTIFVEKAPLRDNPGYRRYNPAPTSRFTKTLYRITPFRQPKPKPQQPQPPVVEVPVMPEPEQPVAIEEEVPAVSGLEEVVEEPTAQVIETPVSAEEEVAKELGLNDQQLQILKMFTLSSDYPVSIDRIIYELYRDDVESWAIERYAAGDDLQTVEKYWERYRTVRRNLTSLMSKLEGKYEIVEVENPDYNQHFWRNTEYEYINDEAMADSVFKLVTTVYNQSNIKFRAFMLSAYAEQAEPQPESAVLANEEIEQDKVHVFETPMRQKIYFVENLMNDLDELDTEEKQRLFWEVLDGIPDGRTELVKVNLTDPTGQLYRLKRNRIRVILYKYGSEYIVVDADRRDEDTFDNRKSQRRINIGEKIARILFRDK